MVLLRAGLECCSRHRPTAGVLKNPNDGSDMHSNSPLSSADLELPIMSIMDFR